MEPDYDYDDEDYDTPMDSEFYDYLYGETCDQKLYESLKDLIDICSSTQFYSSIPILPITFAEHAFRYAEMALQFPYTYCSLVSTLCSMEDKFVYPLIETLVKHIRFDANATTKYKKEILEKILVHACIAGSPVLFDFVMSYYGSSEFELGDWLRNIIHVSWNYLFCRKEYMDDIMIETIQKNRIEFARRYIEYSPTSIDSWCFWFSCLCRRGMYILAEFILNNAGEIRHQFFDLDKTFIYACNTGNTVLIDIYIRFNSCKYNIIMSEMNLTSLGYPTLGGGIIGGKEWIDDDEFIGEDFIIPIKNNSTTYGVIRSKRNETWERMRLFHIRNYEHYQLFIPVDIIGYISTFL